MGVRKLFHGGQDPNLLLIMSLLRPVHGLSSEKSGASTFRSGVLVLGLKGFGIRFRV